jgi:hypothetical protein
MPQGWEAVPLTDDPGTRLETTEERLRAACKILGMTAIGVGIGCLFVFVRWATGMPM